MFKPGKPTGAVKPMPMDAEKKAKVAALRKKPVAPRAPVAQPEVAE